MTFDAQGHLFVLIRESPTESVVAEYDKGTFALRRTISKGLNDPFAIALDASGDLAVANLGNNTVTIYAPGRTAPKFTIRAGVDGPDTLAFDPSGYLYVGNHDASTVTVYAPDTTSVLRTITQGVPHPRYLLLDPSSNLYVATRAGVTMYAAGGSTVVLRLYRKDQVRSPFALAYH